MTQLESALFVNVQYYLSHTLPKQLSQELANILNVNQAQQVERVQDATHVISNTDHFGGWDLVAQTGVVVTPYWIERSVVLGKCQPTEFYSSNPAMIFSGVVACSADLSPADEEVMSGTIIALGGQYRSGLTRDVTHLFALATGTERYDTAFHYQADSRIIILVPHWFDDCVTLHRRLDPTPYSWPDPAVIRSGVPAEDNAAAEEVKIRVAAARVPEEKRSLFRTAALEGKVQDTKYKEALPEYTERDVWKGAKILLSSSLGLSSGRCQAVQAGIWRSGGTVLTMGDGPQAEELELVEEADVVITKYRQGWSYIKALRGAKKIGTLAWVFHVESTGCLSEPTEQLLHYPAPGPAIEGFSKHAITITNYTGEAREYLKRLIIAAGAQFTPSMSQTNTIVMAAHLGGPKTDRATTWSIPVVNHTWLEDCYSQWRNLSPAVNKYILFPTGVDLSLQLGDAGVGRITLDKAALMEQLDALETEAGPLPPVESKVKPQRKPSPNKKKKKAVIEEAETLVYAEQEMKMSAVSRSTSPDLSQPAPLRKKLVRRVGSRKDPGSLAEVEGMLSHEVDSTNGNAHEGGTPPTDYPGPSTTPESCPSSPEPTETAPGKGKTKLGAEAKSRIRRRGAHLDEDVQSNESSVLDIVQPSTSTRHVTSSPNEKRSAQRTAPTTPRKRKTSNNENNAEVAAAVLSPKTAKQVSVEVPALPMKPSSPDRKQTQASSSKRSKIASSGSKPRGGKGKGVALAVEENEVQADALAPTATKKSASKKQVAERSASPPPALADTSMSSQGIDSNGRLRRGAAMRAEGRLKTDMEDLRNFESQRRRGVVIGSWEKDTGKDKEKDPPAAKKKRLGVEDGASDEEGKVEEQPQPKKRKTETTRKGRRKTADVDMDVDQAVSDHEERSASTTEYRVMTTQWDMTPSMGNNLKKLGPVKFVDKEKECTHLVTKQMARTQKFLCALPTLRYLVSPDWITESIKAQKLLDEDDFPIEDAQAKFGVTVAEVLKRRDASKGKLFDGHTFILTPGLDDKLKVTMRSVILANGGKVSSQAPTVRLLELDSNKHLISCEADAKIWKPIVQQGHPVFDKEFVLSSALKQKIDTSDKAMFVPGSKSR